MSTYVIHRARPCDLDAVMHLLNARIRWLRDRGSDQWSTRDFGPVMTRAIANGETWLVRDQDVPVATLTLTTVGDPDFWTPDELTTPALYLSKLATDLDHRGRGLGALLINWANNYAAERDVSTIRWDVWRTNQSLQDYYTRLGIKQLRATQVPGRFSGVLYEVSYQLSQDLNAVTTIAPRGPLHVLDSHLNPAPQVHRSEIDPFDQYPQPHTHTIAGLQVPCLATPTKEAPRDLVVAGDDARRTLLYNPGPGWRLRNAFSHEITAWAHQPDIQAGQLYTIGHETQKDRDCRVILSGDLPAE